MWIIKMEAVEKQDIGWIKLNLEDLRQTFPNVLIFACERGKMKVVEFLLEQKPSWLNVNEQDRYGWTPLFYACNRGYPEIVQKLLSVKGVDPNKPNEYQTSPLICACDKGFVQIVELLLDHPDIDIYAQDDLGLNALMWANYRENQALVKRLLQHTRIQPAVRQQYDLSLLPCLDLPPKTKAIINPSQPTYMAFLRLETQIFVMIEQSIPWFKQLKKNLQKYQTKIRKIIEILKE